jgi:uncharacterized protein (TIGR00369 family)
MTDNWSDRLPHTRSVHDELGIAIAEASLDRVVLTLEVTPTVHQPYGLLHGGVSALMAEGAASIGGVLSVGPDQAVVGTELNCSHLRAVRSGTIRAVATPVRKGRTVQVWSIEILDERDRQICVARCSLQVITTPREHAVDGPTA